MSILFLLSGLLFAAVLGGSLFTYGIAWAVRAGSEPSLMDRRFSLPTLVLATRLVGMEAFALLLTVLLSPLGWLPQGRIRHRESVRPASTPVLLLHGLFQRRSCWWWVRIVLKRAGVRDLHAVNLPLWRDVETAVQTVTRTIEELCIVRGVEKVHLVGHSMGGLVALRYALSPSGAGRVASCTLIGSPIRGSLLAPLAISPLGRALVPSSAFLRDLEATPLPRDIAFHALYSRHDNLVIPYDSGRLAGARNIELSGMGHTGLLYHPKSLRRLAEILKETNR